MPARKRPSDEIKRGLTAEHIFQSGKFEGRTVRATAKHIERLSIVRQKKKVVVRQIRPIGVLTLEEALKRGDEVCSVILYKYPGLACQGRREAFGRVLTIKELNRDLTATARVVVHPKYRTTGLGTNLSKKLSHWLTSHMSK